MIGVSYADATLRKLGVSQFPDTDQFTNLESFILQVRYYQEELSAIAIKLLTFQVGAKECLVLEDKTYDYKKLCDVLERCTIPKVVRPRGIYIEVR